MSTNSTGVSRKVPMIKFCTGVLPFHKQKQNLLQYLRYKFYFMFCQNVFLPNCLTVFMHMALWVSLPNCDWTGPQYGRSPDMLVSGSH